jgi:uncharacterized membrane protein YdjX (TVP38/TMEM64 family)
VSWHDYSHATTIFNVTSGSTTVSWHDYSHATTIGKVIDW